MVKIRRFEISFSNPMGVYYAGQTVQGDITIEVADTVKIRGVYVKFLGKAKVYWTETQEGTQEETHEETHEETQWSNDEDRTTETVRSVRTVHSAKEIYFEKKISLSGRNTNIHLAAGRYVYPFAFQLPPRVPSSFTGKHGKVSYSATAEIDRAWAFDHKTEKAFTVIGILDLNRQPWAATPIIDFPKTPAQGSNSTEFGCCASGPVTATFTIDRHGYVPGEVIVINAEIENMSNTRIHWSAVVMKMKTVYHATNNKKSCKDKIAELRHGEVQEGGADYWNGDQLVIPPSLPPSFLIGCNIIDISYTLKLKVVSSGCGSDLEVPLEVIIGTIPLQHVSARYSQVPPPIARPMVMPDPKSQPVLGVNDPSDTLPPSSPSEQNDHTR